LRSDEAGSVIDGVVFENLRIGGRHITHADDANLHFDPAKVRNVSFR
jgi:hypothetical protein